MAEILADRVKETTASVGTGPIALGGALVGFKAFNAVCTVGDTFYGCIVAVNNLGQPTGQWESGIFTYTAANTVTRTTVHASSNSDNTRVNFATGTKHMFIDLTSRKAIQIQEQINAVAPTPSPTPTDGTTTPAPAPTPTPVPPPTTTPTAPILPYGRESSEVGRLTFNDDFDGNALNMDWWSEHVWYHRDDYPSGITGDKIRVQDGMLQTRAVEPFNQSNSWTWHNVTLATDGKFYQLYGYMEAKMRLPKGGGPWPAFWLYNHDEDGKRPEIDVMEAYPGGGPSTGWGDSSGNPTNFSAVVHRENESVIAERKLNNYFDQQRLDNEWHYYACKWDQEGVQFYFDGNALGPKVITGSTEVKMRMYLLLDYWLGSASGSPGQNYPLDTSWNNRMDVDWVRCWELPDGSTQVWPENWTYPAQSGGSGGQTEENTMVHPATPVGVGPVGQVAADYTIVFSDEFTGTSLDTARWVPRLSYGEDHAIKNYRVIDGRMKIWPQADSSGVFHQRHMESRGLYTRAYGYFEFMANLPRGVGVRPLLRIANTDGGAVRIIETMVALPGVAGWGNASLEATDYQVYLWDVNQSLNARRLTDHLASENLSTEDHVYGVLWDETGIQWFFDGVAVGPKLMTTLFNGKNFYLSLGMDFGKGGSGTPSPSDASLTPQGESNSLEIDYVRAWRIGGSGTSETPVTTVFNVGYYGDSTTMGLTSTDGQNYFQVEQHKAKIFDDKMEALSSDHDVTIMGVSGAKAIDRYNGTYPGMNNRTWAQELAANPQYSHVIIAYGNNEAWDDGTVTAGNYVAKVADMKSTLGLMVDEARTAGMRPILETPNITQYHDFYIYFINAIRDLATEKACGLIDVYQAGEDYRIAGDRTFESLIPDGGHPNAELYGVEGNYVYDRFLAVS